MSQSSRRLSSFMTKDILGKLPIFHRSGDRPERHRAMSWSSIGDEFSSQEIEVFDPGGARVGHEHLLL